MSLAFVIELQSEAVGLVVRDGHQYRFHSAVQKFVLLDGQSFPSPQDAEKAIRQAAEERPSAVAPPSHSSKPRVSRQARISADR